MPRKILLILGLLFIVALVLLKITDAGTALFGKALDSNGWMLILIIAAAALDSINPCAFSILLLTIAFLFSLGSLRRRILAVGAIYIFGLFLVYVLIGLGILGTMQLFGIPKIMSKIGAVLLLAFGLISLLGHYFPNFPIKLKIPDKTHQTIGRLMAKGSYPTAFALGLLVGIFEFPCTGGPYLMVLSLLHDQATYLLGLGYLLLYNLIFVLPLVVILLIASDAALLEKVQNLKKTKTGQMRLWGGVAMVILALIIFLM